MKKNPAWSATPRSTQGFDSVRTRGEPTVAVPTTLIPLARMTCPTPPTRLAIPTHSRVLVIRGPRDGRQDRALDVVLVGDRADRLVLVEPQDALVLEQLALDGDRGAVVARGLHIEREAVAPAPGVDAVVLAIQTPRVGADHADRPVLLVDLPAELFEHRLHHRPDPVSGGVERLGHRLGGRRRGSQRQLEQQRARQDLHSSLPRVAVGAPSQGSAAKPVAQTFNAPADRVWTVVE